MARRKNRDDDIDMDMKQARNRAHAIRGALSTIDLFDIKAKDFWLAFTSDPERELTVEWVRKGARLLTAIEDAYPGDGAPA